MAYNPDNLVSKLSGLSETQESITTVSEWILFHKRYTAKSAETWASALREASVHKKLAMVYVANEVVQQAKIRKKDAFVDAFAAVMPSALADAVESLPPNIQSKIQRVVKVWRERSVFNPQIQAQLDQCTSQTQSQKPQPQNTESSFFSVTASSQATIPELEKLVELTKLHKNKQALLKEAQNGGQDSVLVKALKDAQDAAQKVKVELERLTNDTETALSEYSEDYAALEAPGAGLEELPPPPAVELFEEQASVYTASDAQATYGSDDDEVEEVQDEEPAQKRARFESPQALDPKLASYLASLSQP